MTSGKYGLKNLVLSHFCPIFAPNKQKSCRILACGRCLGLVACCLGLSARLLAFGRYWLIVYSLY